MAGDSLCNWAGSLGRDIFYARQRRDRKQARLIAKAVAKAVAEELKKIEKEKNRG